MLFSSRIEYIKLVFDSILSMAFHSKIFKQILMFGEDTETSIQNLTLNRTEYFIVPSRDLTSRCHYFGSIISTYVDTIVSFAGFLLNLACLFVFTDKAFNYPKRVKCKMFKYLLLKAIFDCMILLLKALMPVFKCEECLMNTTYLFNIFDMLVNK